MSTFTKTVQVTTIFIALASSGAIATLSLFDIPILQAQPASRSLPSLRWLFSRGSHIFPAASVMCCSGFGYLAYSALPLLVRRQGLFQACLQLLKITSNNSQVQGYLAASALTLSISPFTVIAMVPTNFKLIELCERKGGSRSAETARQTAKDPGAARRSLQDSIDGVGQPNQFTDLSGPQERTIDDTSETEDKETKQLLGRFGALNLCRGVLMGLGGIVGLSAALA